MSFAISNFTALVGNELWNLGGEFQFSFDVKPNSVPEILQNLYNIWSVPLGSQVLQRAFGNDVSWIDSPGNIAQMQAQTAFLLSASKWEPRATFNKIVFALDAKSVMAGAYTLYVELTVNLTAKINTQIFGAPQPGLTWVINNTMTGVLPDVERDNLTI